MRTGSQAAGVPPFHAMAMARRAAELEASGRRILHLEVGQPSTGAPAVACQAVARQLAAGDPLGYTNAPGHYGLRRALAARYGTLHGIDVSPDDVMVVGGASAGFTLAFLAAFDPGDRVGVLEPGYPCYRNVLLALGMVPVPIPVGADTRWAPTRELLDAAMGDPSTGTASLRGLVIASPSNPTGTVLDAASLATIAAWCAAHDVQLVADEIYHGITYNGPAPTVLAVNRDAVLINSFSKYWSMTGWRIGWMVVPQHLRDAIERLQQNVYICAPHIAQVAGLAALADEATVELDAHVRRYAANRRLLVDGLATAGITAIADADGAFYVYADVAHLTGAAGQVAGSTIGPAAGSMIGPAAGSTALCSRWLHELGVATTPGLDFDLARGEQFVRFSYAGTAATVTAACDLLLAWKP